MHANRGNMCYIVGIVVVEQGPVYVCTTWGRTQQPSLFAHLGVTLPNMYETQLLPSSTAIPILVYQG